MTKQPEGIGLRSFIVNAPIAVAMFDRDMRYIAVSRRWLSEYSLDCDATLIGKSHYDIFPEIPKRWKALHRRALNGEVLNNKDDYFERPNGEAQWIHWEMAPWYTDNGAIGGIVIVSIDNTPYKKAESELKETSLLLKSIIEHAPTMICLERASNLRFEYFNHAGEEITGLKREHIIGRCDHDLFPKEQADFFVAKDRAALEQHGVVDVLEETIDTRHGKKVLHTKKVALRDDHDRAMYLLGISEDITELQRAERALHERPSQYRSAIETSPYGFWVIDLQGHVVEVNESYARMSGYTNDELIGMCVSDLDANDTAEVVAARMEAIQRLGYARFESAHRRKDGRIWPVEVVTTYSLVQGGRFFAFISDLTERNAMNGTAKLQALILSQIKEGIHIVSASDHTILYTTPVFDAMFGYQSGELIGMDVSVLNAPSRDNPPKKTADTINAVLVKDGYWQGEIVNVRKDRTEMTCWVKVTRFDHHELGRVWIAIHEDISERKNAERELQRAKESAYRDVLVREVHHRIKNNLQGVIGLLRNSARADLAPSEIINKAIGQVQSIAVLHGLQGRSDIGAVAVNELIIAVARNAGSMRHTELRLDIPAGAGLYPIVESESVPVALILNELVTNAVKHASMQGKIEIRVRDLAENCVRVSIDNAGTIPSGFGLDFPESLGTGLQLVSSLMPRAGASIRWEQAGGVVTTIFDMCKPVLKAY